MFAAQIVPGFSVNLNLLETFLIVAETLSFREAARKSGRSPAAVSAQIKQLETQIGTELFHRTTRSVALSDDGAILFEAVKGAFRSIKGSLEQVNGVQPGSGRVIRIACSSSIAWRLLPAPIRKLRERYRNVSVQVDEMSASRMPEHMLDDEPAFGVGIFGETDDRFVREFTLAVPLVAVIPVTMPQSRLSSISFAEIGRLPLLLPSRTSATRRRVEDSLRQCGVRPAIGNEELRFHTLMRMVEAGDGAAVFSALTCQKDNSPHYRVVPIRDPAAFVEIGILRLRRRTLKQSEQKLLDLLREEMTASVS